MPDFSARKPDDTCGVVYVATGKKYVGEAIESARSLKQVMPTLGVTVFSDHLIADPAFDRVIPIERPIQGSADKVRSLPLTPYERTLFLDTDTYVCADLSEYFELLDRFDVLIAHDALRINWGGLPIPRIFPEMNGGVIAFHRERSMAFLNAWEAAYDQEILRHGPRCPDQFTLRSTLYDSKIRFYVLPPGYHCMVWEAAYVCGEVKILHGRHDLPLAAIALDVNRSSGPRIFKAGLGSSGANRAGEVLGWGARIGGRVLMRAVRDPAATVRRLASAVKLRREHQ